MVCGAGLYAGEVLGSEAKSEVEATLRRAIFIMKSTPPHYSRATGTNQNDPLVKQLSHISVMKSPRTSGVLVWNGIKCHPKMIIMARL